MTLILTVVLLVGLGVAQAQWEMQQSRTTANLRGIHAVGREVAWASGSEGTVLHTRDGGAHWQKCATPTGAAKLDFRGVWAWDTRNAVVLAAGPGDQSRLYRTTDGCAHWSDTRRNSDKDGFWDAIVFRSGDFGFLGDDHTGVLVGDPVRGYFYTLLMIPGTNWFLDEDACAADAGAGIFAASNSSAFVFGAERYIFVSGGKPGARAFLSSALAYGDDEINKGCLAIALPLAGGADSAGAFSVAFRDREHGVVVGGDYKKPDDSSGTAAWSSDGGREWTAAVKPPHGYRSAVAWDAEGKMWIAAGTNGTDVSHDDGKTWEHLDNGNWNAISPPYIVGPGGRIGKLISR